MRISPWFLSLFLALGVAASGTLPGCAAEIKTQPAPPPPPPPPPDSDGDGIPDDGTDKCVGEKEDGLPPEAKDGCKTTDPDQDGFVGEADKCPNEAEDKLPPDPKDGCKTTDPDNDGILGAADKCPNEPETVNGYMDEDGCPDTPPRVYVAKDQIKIGEKIYFALGKADIDPKSNELLDEIAKVVNENPQIEFFEVAGHADNVGDPKRNVDLTNRRANAVVEALAKRKVDKRRMRPGGYGEYCPVEKNDTPAGQEKNRRVEFKIMRIDGVETGTQLGCDDAVKAGIKPQPIPKTAPHKAAAVETPKPQPKAPPPPKKK